MMLMKIINGFMLILFPLLVISSSSWMLIWISLEMMSMAFLIFLTHSYETFKKDCMMKYFITQSVASIILLFSFIMNEMNFFFMSSSFENQMFLLMMVSLFIKLGMSPFHSWMIKVGFSLNFKEMMVFLLWQKIIPIILLASMANMMMLIFSMVSMVVGTISQINILNMNLIMIFSSINHMGWMFISMMYYMLNGFLYYFIYFIISIMIFYLINKFNLNLLFNQMNVSMLLSFSIVMYSLGGIPPLLGFLMKWLILIKLMSLNILSLMFMMIIMSSMNFFIYNRFLYKLMVMKNSLIKSGIKFKSMLLINLFIPMNLLIF